MRSRKDQPPLTTKGSGDLGSISSQEDPPPIGDAGCPWEWTPTDVTPRDITLEGLPPPSPCVLRVCLRITTELNSETYASLRISMLVSPPWCSLVSCCYDDYIVKLYEAVLAHVNIWPFMAFLQCYAFFSIYDFPSESSADLKRLRGIKLSGNQSKAYQSTFIKSSLHFPYLFPLVIILFTPGKRNLVLWTIRRPAHCTA